MNKDESKNTLFDLLNEPDLIPVKDLTLEDKNNTISLVLTDDTEFLYVSEKRQKNAK